MGKTKGAKQPKDENKPKRSVSAYFYYLAHCREEFKKAGKQVTKVGEFTKECSGKWNSMTEAQKKPYADKAAIDKKRYDAEMSAYTGKATKDENKPKRAQSAYFLFLADYRKKMKGSDVPNKELITNAGKVWGEMSDSEKVPYQKKHDEEVKKYEKAMEEYRKTGGASSAKKPKVEAAANGGSEEDEEDDDDDEEEEEEESD